MPSVFADRVGDVYSFYRCAVQFTSRVYGGVPLRPDVIEAWIRKGTGITSQQELAAVVRRTLLEIDPELEENARGKDTYELMQLASEKLALSQSSVGFKRDENGLFIESRQIKAGLREATNILFAGSRWGETKKGPKSWVAERVFIGPERIYLGVSPDGQDLSVGDMTQPVVIAQEPTNVELFVGHVTGPQGPRSTLTYYQYVERARIEFMVAVIQNDVIKDNWHKLWVAMENEGFGALRSQDAGRFDTIHWAPADPVPLSSLKPSYERQMEIEAEEAAEAAQEALSEQLIASAAAAGGRSRNGGRVARRSPQTTRRPR